MSVEAEDDVGEAEPTPALTDGGQASVGDGAAVHVLEHLQGGRLGHRGQHLDSCNWRDLIGRGIRRDKSNCTWSEAKGSTRVVRAGQSARWVATLSRRPMMPAQSPTLLAGSMME